MTGRFKLVLLAGIALAVYANTLGHDFAYDDFWFLVHNPTVRSFGEALRTFSKPAEDYRFHYRPLTTLSFGLDYAAAGLRPWFYHAENILLHVVVTLLVFLVLRPLGEETAWLAAALFAVLSVHTEVVANVASRSELLASALGLAALWRWPRPWLAAMLLFLALLAKENPVVVPALVPLLWWRQADQLTPRRQAWVLGWLVAAVGAYLLLRALVHGRIFFPLHILYSLDNPLALADWATRVRTALMIVGQNLALCFVPYHLSADYSAPQIPLVTAWSEPRFLFWSLLPVAGLAIAFTVRRAHPNLLRGLLWFLVALAPVSNLVIPIGTIRADRLLYLPSVGTCLVAAEILGLLLATRRRLAWVLVAALLVTLGALAAHRNLIWRNQETLVRAMVADAPRSARAHYLLAAQQAASRNCPSAVDGFRRALELFPEYWGARLGLAACQERLGDLAGAEQGYREVFRLDPQDRLVGESLARVCEKRNDWPCVATTMRRLLAANQQAAADPASWLTQGNALFHSGELKEAEVAYRRAIALGGSAVAHFNLAGVLVRLGRFREAVEQFQAAEQKGMTGAELYEDWAQAQRRAGDTRGARETAARGFKLFPDSEALRKLAR